MTNDEIYRQIWHGIDLEAEGLLSVLAYDNGVPVWRLGGAPWNGRTRIIHCYEQINGTDPRHVAEGLSLILARHEMKRTLIMMVMPAQLANGWLMDEGEGFLEANCPDQSVILAGDAPDSTLTPDWNPPYMTDGTRGVWTVAGEVARTIVDWKEDIDVIRGKRTRYPVLNAPRFAGWRQELPTAAPDARMGFRQETELPDGVTLYSASHPFK